MNGTFLLPLRRGLRLWLGVACFSPFLGLASTGLILFSNQADPVGYTHTWSGSGETNDPWSSTPEGSLVPYWSTRHLTVYGGNYNFAFVAPAGPFLTNVPWSNVFGLTNFNVNPLMTWSTNGVACPVSNGQNYSFAAGSGGELDGPIPDLLGGVVGDQYYYDLPGASNGVIFKLNLLPETLVMPSVTYIGCDWTGTNCWWSNWYSTYAYCTVLVTNADTNLNSSWYLGGVPVDPYYFTHNELQNAIFVPGSEDLNQLASDYFYIYCPADKLVVGISVVWGMYFDSYWFLPFQGSLTNFVCCGFQGSLNSYQIGWRYYTQQLASADIVVQRCFTAQFFNGNPVARLQQIGGPYVVTNL